MSTQAGADLQHKMAAFLAAGGAVVVVPGFEGIAPLPPRREPPPSERKPRRYSTKVKRPRPSRQGRIDDHLERIRELAKTMTSEQVAEAIGYGVSTVKSVALRNGIRFEGGRGRPYTEAEIEKAKQLAATHNIYEAAELMNRTRSSLRSLAKRQGIAFRDGLADSRRAIRKFNSTIGLGRKAKPAGRS
ncbi:MULTISPECIES: hypothetical protein [unclassified Pseudomonas]|uniref:hypothetical protein n=1 Tax=unclassified Pseudomonas TaxID=196821 RepID=UPI0024478013|nr:MULTISPECIES: hypothetical protein [unclassified Pseudomonas]MDG9928293.1 hypothetical protein [Pseudomonas sp. GD04042]MDH0481143.1 hypothetical protein [Pseudomonas sp. GD04015]MDH0604479.1 hypothetical protein [Pseudomonas sp. GD03869]